MKTNVLLDVFATALFVIFSSAFSAQECATEQIDGSCSHWYEDHAIAGKCPSGSTVQFAYRVQVPQNSSVEIRWYWTDSEEDAGRQGTLIQTEGSTKYLALEPQETIPVHGRMGIVYTLQVHNFNENDTGFYWCQMVINETIPLEPSCPIELTAVLVNETVSADTCTDTGTFVSQKCADIMSIPETTLLYSPTPSTSAGSSHVPETSIPSRPPIVAMEGTRTILSSSPSSPSSPSSSSSTATTTRPISSSNPPSSSRCEVGGSSCSVVYGAIGAAALVVMVVIGTMVALFGCVYLSKKRKRKGKGELGNDLSAPEPMVAVEYAVVQKEKEKLEDTCGKPVVVGQCAVAQKQHKKKTKEAPKEPSQGIRLDSMGTHPHPADSGEQCLSTDQTVDTSYKPELPTAQQVNEIHDSITTAATDVPRSNTAAGDCQHSQHIETNSGQGAFPQVKSLAQDGNHDYVSTGAMNSKPKSMLGVGSEQEMLKDSSQHEYDLIPNHPQVKSLARDGNHDYVSTGAMNSKPKSMLGVGSEQEMLKDSSQHEYDLIPNHQQRRQREIASKGEGSRHSYESLDEDVCEDAEYAYATIRVFSLKDKRHESTEQHRERKLAPLSGQTTNPNFYHVLEEPKHEGSKHKEVMSAEEEDEHYYSTVRSPKKEVLPPIKSTHTMTSGDSAEESTASQTPFDDPTYGVSGQTMPGTESVETQGEVRAVGGHQLLETGNPHFYHTLEGPLPVVVGNEYDYCTPQALIKPKPTAAKERAKTSGHRPMPGKPSATSGPSEEIQTPPIFDDPQYQVSCLTIPIKEDKGPRPAGPSVFDDVMYATAQADSKSPDTLAPLDTTKSGTPSCNE